MTKRLLFRSMMAMLNIAFSCTILTSSRVLLHAQTINVGDIIPQSGDVVRMIYGSPNFAQMAGIIARANANAPWDFRDVRPRPADSIIRTYGAVPDSLRTAFPMANLMQTTVYRTSTNASALQDLVLMRTGPDSVAFMGVRTVIAGQALIYPYTNPETRLRLPLSAGTTYTRVLAARVSATFVVNGISLPVVVQRVGTLRTAAEVGGTITLPASDGTLRAVSAALRVRTTINLTDSVSFMGIPVPATPLPVNDTTIAYYASSSRYALAEVNYGNQTVINEANPTSLPPNIVSYRTFFYNNTLPAGTSAQASSHLRTSMKATLAPNPAERAQTEFRFTLSTPKNIMLGIFDITGREVFHAGTLTFQAGDHVVTLPTDQLPSGMYIVRAQVGNELIGSSLVVR
jgi:hypothetical protein